MDGSLAPLAGGYSGETYLSDLSHLGGGQTVVRIYAGRSAARGPLAPEIDAAVLELVRGLVPVPRVLEVRRGDDAAGLPGLLVTERLPGVRLDLALPELRADQRRAVGLELGTLLGRLGHVAQPRPGLFRDRSLVARELPPELRDLEAWVDAHEAGLTAALGADALTGLRETAAQAQDLLEEDPRACLVHGDLNAKNLLLDPERLEVTGLVDWEFAHAGSPYSDLGNLLRGDLDPDLREAVLAGYRAFMPAVRASVPDDLLDRAWAADLFALVELAAGTGDHPPADQARALLRRRRLGWTLRGGGR